MNVGSQTMQLFCASLTFGGDPAVLTQCGGVADGTVCSGCDSTTKLVGGLASTVNNVNPLDKATTPINCNTMNQFTGVCHTSVCVGNPGRVACDNFQSQGYKFEGANP